MEYGKSNAAIGNIIKNKKRDIFYYSSEECSENDKNKKI